MFKQAYLTKNSLPFIVLICILLILPLIDSVVQIPHLDFFVLSTGILGLVIGLLTFKNKPLSLYGVDLAVLIFVSYQVIHFLLFSSNRVSDIQLWERLAFFGLYVGLRLFFNWQGSKVLKGLVYIISAKVCLELLLGILQWCGLVNSIRSDSFKLVGTFTSPNFYACVLGVGIVLSIKYLIVSFKKWPITKMIISISAFTVLLVLLVFTKSRSALIATIICTGFLFLTEKRSFIKSINPKIKAISILILIILITAGGYGLYQLKKGSADGRILTAKITSLEIKNKPMLGHSLFSFVAGYNNAKANYFNNEKRDWNETKHGNYIQMAMNDYLELTYETGIIGLILALIICVFLFKDTEQNKIVLSGKLIVLFFILSAFFTSVSHSYQLVVLVILGAILTLYKQKTYFTITHKTGRYTLYGFSMILFVGLIFMGSAKLHAESFMRKNLATKEKTKQTQLATWEYYFNINANKGLSDFVYGNMIYNCFSKDDGLTIMEKAIKLTPEPKNVKQLAIYNTREKNYASAEKLFQLNIGYQPFRFEPKMDIMKLYDRTMQNEKLCKLAKEVVNFPVKIPSEKVEEHKRVSKVILEKYNCMN